MVDQQRDRISVYLDTHSWRQFHFIIQRKGLVKNTIIKQLCESWIAEQLRDNPELSLTEDDSPAPLIIPQLQL